MLTCRFLAAGLVLAAGSIASAGTIIDAGSIQPEATYAIGHGSVSSGRAVDPNSVYSNVTNFLGSAAAPGGAVLVGTTLTTNMIADDAVTVAPGGVLMTQFRFSMANLNTTTQSCGPQIRFFANDGAGGGPGTLLGGFNFNPISMTAGSVSVFNFAIPLASQFFVTPSMWIGEQFAATGASTANTAALLNNFALGLFNPVDRGSSADRDFLTTAPGTQASNNPSGAIRVSPFSANPIANYGFEVIPAPSSLALLGLGGLVAARRRRA